MCTVTNTGNTVLHDVTIDDPAEPDCEVAPFDLALGAARTVDCSHLATEADIGTYTNIASVTAAEIATPVESNPAQRAVAASGAAVSAGSEHSSALSDVGTVHCWGNGADGRLGYANTTTVGDDETPGSVGAVYLGLGRTATQVAAGADHTCALLDDGTVRCWGSGAEGQLGYGNTNDVGDDEHPAAAGPVDLGAGRTATEIVAGTSRTCAVLDDGSVRCWGNGDGGGLGYATTDSVGDDETPGSVGPVDLGAGARRST